MELAENELVVLIPSSFATGEPGDPLTEHVKNIIYAMVGLNYWPLDFGESDGNSTELVFLISADPSVSAREQADRFIQLGGDV